MQHRSARWATHDYQRTSSVTQVLQDVNWHTLEQRQIDSRLTLTYKITYDLVAIPAADYLIPNTRQSRHNHLVAYKQIPTLKDYYKCIFFPHTIVRPPISHPYPTYCGTIQSCCVLSIVCPTVDIKCSFIFLLY